MTNQSKELMEWEKEFDEKWDGEIAILFSPRPHTFPYE